MSKILILFLVLSLLVVFAQCKHGIDDDHYGGGHTASSGDDDWDDGDDDDDNGSGWPLNQNKDLFPRRSRPKNRFTHWKHNGRTIIHLKNCNVPNCMICRRNNCRHCMPGFQLRRLPHASGKRCLPICPLGKRDANGRCQNNACQSVPNCLKCSNVPWSNSCMKCKNGWYRYKALNQMNARCVKVCPRGYRANSGSRNVGASCEKIPFFCPNTPNCLKCAKFPWTRSCMRCKNGWYRYKAPYQMIANCVKVCPRGYRGNSGSRGFGPTCEKIPFFCPNTPNCVKCAKFPWTRSCIRCKNGWYRHKAPYQKIANCVKVCPRGYRGNSGSRSFGPTCEKIPSFCFNAPNCVKCAKFPWTRSCIRCKNGWYRYKAPYQMIANCVKVCPRGYRGNSGSRNVGPTCEKIPFFCFNTPNCVKCAKASWNRSCMRCRNGWYRYKAPYQMIANCVKVCPRGYQGNAGSRGFGPTCEKVPSFCDQVQNCKECEGPRWDRSCKKCEKGWYRYKTPYHSSSRCVKVCPRGYRVINGTRNYGPTCKKISSFCRGIPHCKNCPGSSWSYRSCKRCQEGWYRHKPPYQKTTTCIKTCPRGYRATDGTRKFGPTCKKIPSFCLRLRHCKECPEEFPLSRSCKRCEDGFYLYTAPYQVIAKCIKTCPRGYQATNGTSDIGPSCEQIPSFCHDVPHCKECPGPSWFASCDRCEEGWYRYKNPPLQVSAICVQDCPPGYQTTNGTGLLGPTCERKQSKCSSMPGCQICPKSNICLKCKAGMSLFKGLLESMCIYKCPRGFDKTIKNGTSVCVAQEGCLDKLCIECKKGWYKLDHQGRVCHKECPSGHFKYHGHCIRCTSGCRKCKSVFRCDVCARDMAKLTSRLGFGERCVLNCPRGYTKELLNDTSYECRKVCRDKNCENCESVSYHGPYHCDYCKLGFHKLHRELRDNCVVKCPAGYAPEMDDIEGSVCRKDDEIDPTWEPIPTTSDEDLGSTPSFNKTILQLP